MGIYRSLRAHLVVSVNLSVSIYVKIEKEPQQPDVNHAKNVPENTDLRSDDVILQAQRINELNQLIQQQHLLPEK